MTQFEQLATLQKEAKTNFELISFWDAGYRVRIGDSTNGYKVEQTFDQMDSAVSWLIEELEKNVQIINNPSAEGGGYMRYLKFFLAAAATIISGVVVAMTGDSTISNVEWVNIGIAGAGALMVFTAPNVPGALYTKFLLSAITAALTLLTSFITDGVSTSEWLQIAVAVLGSAGVYAVPNSTNEAMSANPNRR